MVIKADTTRLWTGSLLLLIALLAAGPSSAQQKCSDIADDAARLACWDAAAPSGQPPEQPTAPSPWEHQSSRSPVNDFENHFVFTASDIVLPSSGDEVGLIMRCVENTTSVVIGAGARSMFADSDGQGRVVYRIDSNPAQTKNFTQSTDYHALGLWSGSQAIPFIKQLFGATRLLVRVTPYREAPVDLVFNIEGVEQAAAPVRKACGW